MRQYGALVGVIVLARFAAFIARMHIAPFYPELMRLYKTDYAGIGVLFSSFFWGYAASLLPAGWLADRVSPRIQIGLGLLVMGLGTAVDGFAGTYRAAFLLRLLEGAGVGLTYPAILRVLASALPRNSRGKIAGLMEIAIAAAMFVSLSLAPVAVKWAPVSALFAAMGILCFAGLAALRSLPNHAVVAMPDRVKAAAFRVLGAPFLMAVAISLLGLTVVNVLLGWLPAYFETGLGLSKPVAGAAMTIVLIAEVGAALPGGALSDRTGDRIPVIAWGTAALVVSPIGFLLSGHWKGVWLFSALVGLGTAWGVTQMTLFIAEIFGPQRAGLTTGITTAVSNAGSGLILSFLGWTIDVTGGFQWLWILCAALVLLRLWLLISFARSRRCKTAATASPA